MTNRRKWLFRIGALLCVVGGVGLLAWWFTRPTYTEPRLSFDGSSDQLQHTVIVPTLDTPIPAGKNAIWCASFQIAWNKLKSDVAKGPVQIKGAEELAGRLNKSPVTEADLPERSYYAAAGLAKDAIEERIQREMATKFPDGPKPTFPRSYKSTDLQLAFAAYGYLQASAKFTIPFFANEEPLGFEGANGNGARVSSFGILNKHKSTQSRLREQIQVIFVPEPERGFEERPNPDTFALDLCEDSSNQLIVARPPKGQSLGDHLRWLGEKTEQSRRDEHGGRFKINDTLAVPVLHWRIDHRFSELEGPDRVLLNPPSQGWFIGEAVQSLRFKLDRSGAEVRSEFNLFGYKSGPRAYICNRSFLIVLKKRDAANPFFVMWVDNAELLQKWEE